MNERMIDLNEAARFLDMLAPGEQEFSFQLFDDDKERSEARKKAKEKDPFARVLNGSLAQHAGTLERLNAKGAGVFVTINRTDLKGRCAENIIGVRALFVDLDGSPLEPVLAADIAPDIVVESSPERWHAYWLVRDCPLDQFKPAQQALIARFNSDPSGCDLPRVLRLPGFWHQKGDPFMVRIREGGREDDIDLI